MFAGGRCGGGDGVHCNYSEIPIYTRHLSQLKHAVKLILGNLIPYIVQLRTAASTRYPPETHQTALGSRQNARNRARTTHLPERLTAQHMQPQPGPGQIAQHDSVGHFDPGMQSVAPGAVPGRAGREHQGVRHPHRTKQPAQRHRLRQTFDRQRHPPSRALNLCGKSPRGLGIGGPLRTCPAAQPRPPDSERHRRDQQTCRYQQHDGPPGAKPTAPTRPPRLSCRQPARPVPAQPQIRQARR